MEYGLVLAFNKRAAVGFDDRLRRVDESFPPTDEQRAIIESPAPRILVNANPGSGKSATGIERVKALCKDPAQVDVRTFHSFALREGLRRWQKLGYRRMPRVNTQSIFFHMCDANHKDARSWEEAGWDESVVDEASHSLYDVDLVERIEALADKTVKEPGEDMELSTLRAIQRTRMYLLQQGMVTFDAMVRHLAEHRNEILVESKVADHIIVDEFQDVDRFQYDIVEALCRNKSVKSLVAVGDPKQLIYVWRGALPDAFQRFEQNVENTTGLVLTRNFRSKDEILRFADEFWPAGLHGVRGSDPGCVVRDWDGGAGNGSLPFENPGPDAMILCRYNRDCYRWLLRLVRAGKPAYVLGKGEFWQTRHIKLAVEFWKAKRTYADLTQDDRWKRFTESRRFRGEEGAKQLQEVKDDVYWIMSLSESEMDTLRNCVQNEGTGTKISTIHKVKGLEYGEVMIHNACDGRLADEREVYYVAVTRAKNRLVLT